MVCVANRYFAVANARFGVPAGLDVKVEPHLLMSVVGREGYGAGRLPVNLMAWPQSCRIDDEQDRIDQQ